MKTLCKAILAAALPMLVPAAFGGVTSDVAVADGKPDTMRIEALKAALAE